MNSFDEIQRLKAEAVKDNLIIKRHEMDKRCATIIRDRKMHEERRNREEKEKEENKAQRLDTSNYEKEKAKDEELKELERQKIRDAKYRQQLMESPEIKELQLQLRMAYTRKELQVQIEEKRLEKLKASGESYEKERKEIDELVNQVKKEELTLQQEELIKKTEYRKVLQDQMIDKYKEKQEEYRRLLKERALLDDAVRIVLEEDQKELERQKKFREKCKNDIEAFKSARAIWALQEKLVQEDEERRIQEYWDQKAKHDEEMEQKLREKREKLARSQEVVAGILSQVKDTRDEHTNVIQLIAEEELRKKQEERELEEAKKELRLKREVREIIARQIEDRLQRLYLEKLEDEEFIKKKLEEYEEGKKYQQMTDQKKRLMKLEYQIGLKKELDEKILRRKIEEEQLLELKKMETAAAKERSKILEEERIRLLKDHAMHVLGFLPAGSLKPSDLPHLPPDVSEFYSAKPSPLGQPPR